MNRWTKWEHGRVHTAASTGKLTYYIRERRGGVLYEFAVSHTRDGAAKQYDAFDKDPQGYRPPQDTSSRLALDDRIVREYIDHCVLPEAQGGAGNGGEWTTEKARQLDWWKVQLRGRDLRRLQMADLRGALEPAGRRVRSYGHKVEALKAFFAWMREKRDFPHHLDPTPSLRVPQARPGSRKVLRKAFTRDAHESLVARLTGTFRDIIIMLSGTGWHVSEVLRFAQGGSIESAPAHWDDEGAVGVVVCPMHKSGEEHRTAVVREVLNAAERLRKHGGFSEAAFYKAVRDACTADPAITPPIKPGQYRHAVATWAIEAGADPAVVATFLGHRSPATTKRFYAMHAVPPRVPTLAG